MRFLNIDLFLHPKFQIFKQLYLVKILSYPNKFIYSAFILCINLNFKKCTFMTGFVVQGHI